MNRVLVRLALAALLLSAGCQGLPPSVRSAHREAGAAVERYRAGYLSVATAYVRDLSTLLDDAASSASESELRAKVADGSVKLDDALAVLKAARVRRAKIRTKLEAVRASLATNERNFGTWRTLARSIDDVLLQLERRKQAEDALADRAKTAAASAVAIAEKGGTP